MKKKSIWIVDDDSIYKFVIQKLISKIDLFENVRTFSNGEEATIALKKDWNLVKELPDIILLDIEMPIMDGWGFISEIDTLLPKINEKNIKIFISSSSIANEDKEKADRNPHIEGYYTKPITLEGLIEIGSGS